MFDRSWGSVEMATATMRVAVMGWVPGTAQSQHCGAERQVCFCHWGAVLVRRRQLGTVVCLQPHRGADGGRLTGRVTPSFRRGRDMGLYVVSTRLMTTFVSYSDRVDDDVTCGRGTSKRWECGPDCNRCPSRRRNNWGRPLCKDTSAW
jgi:hypothetical protein